MESRLAAKRLGWQIVHVCIVEAPCPAIGSGKVVVVNQQHHAGAVLKLLIWRDVPGSWAQVGLVAINDGIVLESCIYRILQKHFRRTPQYMHLLELFHEVLFHCWQVVQGMRHGTTVIDGHLRAQRCQQHLA